MGFGIYNILMSYKNGFIHLLSLIVIAALITGGYWVWKNYDVQEFFCAQVVVKAKNPINGEVKEFSTPCEVPEGWQKIETQNPKLEDDLVE